MDMEIQNAKFNLIMDNINRFLGNNTNWSLGTAWYRYGGGFFFFVSPFGNYSKDFCEMANMPSDIESTSFYFHVNNQGSWLPIVYVDTLKQGVNLLNQKLQKELDFDSLQKIQVAYDKLIDVSDNNYGLYNELRLTSNNVLISNS